MLRFQVLGALRAFRGEQEITLGPAKQRALLGVLLLRAGQSVPRADIIAGVWGENAPHSAPNLVATYVAGLRRALEPDRPGGQAQLIRSCPGGYLIKTDRVDLLQFDADIAAAQDARQHNLDSCAAYLDQALERWQGTALEGVPGPHADHVRAHLAERRLAVVEQRIEVDLARGRHAGRVAELFRLAAEHPLREPLHGMLMQALRQSGRQAEALHVFHKLHRTLADELGVQPATPLRELHQRILAEDRPVRPARSRVPRQLPADLRDFVGRTGELASVGADFCVITGSAGTGKTALAVRAAHRMAHRFPDGQLFVDLHGSRARPRTPGEVIGRLLTDLGAPIEARPTDVEQLAALLRTTMSGLRVLLVLDDARDGAHVQHILPGDSGSAVLVTTRTRMPGLPGAGVVHLSTLDNTTARTLLAKIIGPDRMAAEPGAAKRIVELCDGLPHSLRAAGTRLVSRPMWTLAEYAERLADERNRLGELAAPVRLDHLAARPDAPAADAARVFRLLGILPGPDIGRDTAAAILGVTAWQAERTLELLADANLVEPTAGGGYRFHDLLRLHAREQADQHEHPSVLDGLRDSALNFYRTAAYQADLVLRPGRRIQAPPQRESTPLVFPAAHNAIEWWENERANLVGLTLTAARQPNTRPLGLATLLTDIRGFLHRRGHWDDWHNLGLAVLKAAQRAQDTDAEAVTLLELGTLTAARSQFDAAVGYLRGSIELFQRAGDEHGQGRALNNLAVVHTNRGEHLTAANELRLCLKMQRANADIDGECITLDNLAMLQVQQRGYAAARESCEHSIRLRAQAGTPSLSAVALTVLGRVHTATGQHDEALTAASLALRLARDDGNRYREAYALKELGSALHAAGRPRAALEPLESALTMQRQVDDQFGIIGASRSLAAALHALGRHATAARYKEEADELALLSGLPV